ncbi:MAG: alpha/beta hydrolase [Candidatus Thiodiazotropha sp. (ex Codakia rugifera)]|nr:alpha/beta hydrolase [Candidatus Thiodiazotropha sp. (ex Codakia rugifera)]
MNQGKALRMNKVIDASCHPFKTQKAKEEYLKLYDDRAKRWPVASTTKMVNTAYGKTFVRISGLDIGEPLVLMHGVGGNSLQWMSNIESLSKQYKVFAIDNINDNGRSIPVKSISSTNDYISWLDELFDKLGLKEGINIVSLSYGGWIASQYALIYPERINKLVLLAPVGTVAQLSLGWVARAVLVALPFKYFSRKFVYWLAEDTLKYRKNGHSLVEEHIDETFIAVRSFKGKRMVNPTVLSDEELNNIEVPVLFMVGENEKIYSPGNVIERLNRVAPKIKTRLIRNAGHDLVIAQPKIVNDSILEYLSVRADENKT